MERWLHERVRRRATSCTNLCASSLLPALPLHTGARIFARHIINIMHLLSMLLILASAATLAGAATLRSSSSLTLEQDNINVLTSAAATLDPECPVPGGPGSFLGTFMQAIATGANKAIAPILKDENLCPLPNVASGGDGGCALLEENASSDHDWFGEKIVDDVLDAFTPCGSYSYSITNLNGICSFDVNTMEVTSQTATTMTVKLTAKLGAISADVSGTASCERLRSLER